MGTSDPASPQQSDEVAAQSYFDDEINGVHTRMDGIEEQLGEMQEAITHLANSIKIGNSSAGPSANEPGRAARAPQRQQEQASPAGGAGQSGGNAPAREPEQAPKPAHWYFRGLFGR